MHFFRAKETVFPKEFDDALKDLHHQRNCAEDMLKAMEKMFRDYKNEQKVDEIGAISKVCERYLNVFGDGPLTAILTTTATCLSLISKKEVHLRKECVDQVLTPIKVWIEDEYVRLIRDVDKCRKLQDAMDSAAKAAARKPSPESTQRYETAKADYNKSFEMCKAELDRMKKVNQHHMNCMKLLNQHHMHFYKSADDELDKATDAMTKTTSRAASK